MKSKFIFYHFLMFTLFLNVMIGKGQTQTLRIKKQTLIQYNIVNGLPGTEGRVISENHFNESNLTTELINYKEDGSILTRETYQYDEEDRVIESESTSSETNLYKRMTYRYDGQFLIESLVYDITGSVSIILAFKYDEQGQLVETLSRSPDNKVYVKTLNYYDNANKIERSVAYDEAGKVLTQANFSYTDQGLVSQKYGINGMMIQRTEKMFDTLGNLIEETHYDAQGRITSKISKQYDMDSRIIESSVEMPAAQMKTRTTNKYDDDGNLTEQISYNKLDEAVKVVRLVYEFYE